MFTAYTTGICKFSTGFVSPFLVAITIGGVVIVSPS
jgi:hypothetical protein